MNKIFTAISRKTSSGTGFFVKGVFICLIVLTGVCIDTNAQVTLTATAGIPAGSYTTLKGAFDAINSGDHHGNIIININANTTEVAPATLNSTDADPASYTSVLIQPTADNIVISGDPGVGFGLIQLNGADNITINGDNPNSGGLNRNLTINNTSAAAVIGNSCIRIATSAVVTSADNISILNTILNGNVTSGNAAGITATGSSSNISFGIYAGGNGGATASGLPTAITSETTNPAVLGTSIKSFTVQNNAINQCARGVVFNAANSSVSNGVSITQNVIGTAAALGTYPYTAPASTVYVCGVWVAGGNVITVSDNILNNVISYVSTAISGIELNANNIGTASIADNTINGVVNNNAAAASPTSAIVINSSGGAYTISGNDIANVENHTAVATAPAGGVRINSVTAAGTISFNKITGIFNRNNGIAPAQGINLAAAANGIVIENNFISDVMNIGNASFLNTGNANGILLNSGSNHLVYHNSINLFGVSGATGTNSINCLAITSNSQKNIDIRNNIFSNTVTGGAASNAHTCLFFPFGSSAAMGLILNNNAYYTGSTAGLHVIAFAGGAFYNAPNLFSVTNFNPSITTGATNWRNFSSGLGVGSNDFASFGSTIAAPFTTATNLHIPAASVTQLESGGIPVGVTVDIDAAARDLNYPDIGADEFAGVIVDATAPVITYTRLLNTCITTDRLLLADITDPSDVPTTGSGLPVLYWSINGVAQPPVTGVFVSGSQYQFIFGAGVALGDNVTYYVVAQDNLGNVIAEPSLGAGGYSINPPDATTAPSTPSSYTIQGTLPAGTYDVGSGQTYTTITAAINDYNNSCPGGAIIFRLMDATYPAETYPIVIANPQASSVNTLTIIPNAGVAVTVSGNNASSLFKLNGSNYIKFDGLNTGGSSLTVTNTNAASTAVVFWIASASATDGAGNNSIVNCTISGSGSNTTLACIMSGSGTTLGNTAAAANSNNTISGCTMKSAQNGISINGYAGTLDQNWTISNNNIGSTVAAEKMGIRGISLQWVNNFNVTGNMIAGIVVNSASTATGISISNTATIGTIAKNNISDVKQNNITGGSCGINLASTINGSIVSVNNNFISDIYSVGSPTLANNASGILVSSGGGYSIYYNSVNMTAAAGASNSISAAIRISSAVTVANGLNIRNNIFSNTTATGNRFSIYNGSTAAIFSSIDYNDYYSASSPVLGFQGGNITSFGAWQAATSGDVKSVSINPLFVSATDSHLQVTSPLNALAITIAGLTTDIDGDTRTASPDIGADEFDASNCSGTPIGGTITSSAASAFCGSGSAFLYATGFSAGDGTTYQWQSSPNNFSPTITNMPGQTVPANSSTGVIAVTTYYRLKVTCSNGGGIAYSNVLVITVNSPVISTTTPGTRCGTGPVTLTATSVTAGATLNWYSSPSGGSSLGSGSPFATPPISTTTTFYVAATLGSLTGKVGPATPTAEGGTIGTQTINWETFFDVLQTTTLISVDIFPNTSGVSSSLLLRNSSGTLLSTIPYTTNVAGGQTAQTILINYILPAGTGYYLEGAMPTGGLQRNTSGAGYPYTSSQINITGNGFLNSYYMCYYNFQFSSSCTSARTAVTATVTPAPPVTGVASAYTVCAGSSTSLSASSSNLNYTYVWMPGSLPGTPVTVNPPATITYTVTGTDLSGGPNNGCVATDTVRITTNQLPSTVTVTPATATVCANSLATLLTSGGGILTNVSAISENFNTATNSWTTVNNSTGGTPANAAWTLRPNGYNYDALTFNSNDASQFYLSNSADQGSGSTTNTILQSPVFSLSGYTTANLSFWHYFRYLGGEEAIAEASTNGSTWTPLPGGTYTSTQGSSNGFVNANLNMNSYAGQPIVYVRFRFSNATFAYYWAIDNVNVSGDVNTVFTWTQSPAAPNSMFTDAGGSIPYTAGTDANSIYVQPGVTTTYTSTATGPAPASCSKNGTSTITVIPPVSVTIVASANPACPSANVTFTATIISGGPSPTYQWQVNGANVANTPTYTYSPSDLDQIKVIVSGNGTCTFGNPATSNTIIMSVTGPLAVDVTIAASPGNFVCEGVPVTYTATPINGGTAPIYQWKKNGVNVGTNSPTYTYTYSYAENGDAITLDMTSNSICISGNATVTSQQILMTVDDNGPTGVVIGTTLGSNTVCVGTQVTVRATPTRPGQNPIYEYFLNNVSQGQQASNDFIFTPINGDKVKVKLKSNYLCLVGVDTAKSNTLTMTVVPAAPASVSMTNTATLCSGSSITFTAAPTNGGAGPTYNFLLNGISVQNTASNTYTLAAPVNGNTVQVILTSNYSCVTTNPASSGIYTVTLNASPVVSAAADCNNLLPGSGQSAVLTATATAGSGSITSYQWLIGGVPIVGATSPTYSTNVTGSYTVIVTNSNTCSTTSGPPVVITSTGAALAAGTYNIPSVGCGGFDKISSAVNYINTYGVAGAVIFNIAPAYTETAPPGGFAITATGTAANTITFKRNGAGANPVVTAGLQVAGNNNDAVFKIIGGDYITIQDLTLQENAGNTVTATGATNTMTEWGVALLYLTSANGPNNNTIQNNIISLNKTYPNSFGIYSNMRHGPATLNTQLDLATATGGQNKIYGNTISNVNNPIWFIGPNPFTNALGNDIGGASSTTANIITDWGTNTANSGVGTFFGISPTICGIFASNQASLNISWNSLTSATGINAGATGFRGITADFATNAGATVSTISITNNTVLLNSAATTGAFDGIVQTNGSGLAGSGITINMNNNTISMTLTGVASASPVGGITNFFPASVVNMSNNIIKGNTSTATTSGFNGIVNSASAPVSTAININNNQFGDVSTDAISFSAATNGTVRAISVTAAGAASVLSVNGNSFTRFVHNVPASAVHTYINISATPATQNINNNSFTNITNNGSGALTCISSAAASANKVISGNSFTNITNGAGQLTMISTSGGTTLANVNTNNIGNSTANSIKGTGPVTGIDLSNVAGAIASITANTVSGLSCTGAGASAVIGINSAAPTSTISNNSIDTLASSGVASAISGILVVSGTTVNASLNRIHTLNGTGTGNVSSNGISVAAGTTVNLFKNKIYNLSQQGVGSTAPLVNGISIAAGTTVAAYNNFISDLKAPAASLATDAIRGISVTSTATTSSYNIYYNSIYLNATGGTNFGTTGIFHTGDATTTTATLTLRNNIIDNESTPSGTGKTVVFRRGSALANLVNYHSSSNNNGFYAGTPGANNLIFYDGTNSDQTLSAFQARVNTPVRDAASTNVKPNFINVAATPYDLHLKAGLSCSFDGQGNNSTILVPDDIDGDPRSILTPFITDIGADEFLGTGGGIGVWKGVNTDWMDILNWCDALPTSTTNVTIPVGAPNYPIITTTGPVVNNITIDVGGSVTITGVGKLGIYGSISTSGTFNVVDGTIELAGSAAQTIPAGSFQNNDLKNLIINNTGVTLGGTLNLYSKLSYSKSNCAFATGGFLVLRSTATGTASVGDITNNGANSGNTITGDVSVERFAGMRRAWRFLSVPTQHNLQTIHESWQENQAPFTPLPVGYGVQISKDSANYNTTGFDMQTPAGPSMKTYNVASNSWKGITSTIDVPGVNNGRFVTGTGYMILVRGDRTINFFQPVATTTTVLRDKGALVTGTFAALAIGANQFAAIGNPFASAVDFTKLTKGNLQDVYYLWDPYLGALGNYVTFAGPAYLPVPSLSYGANKYIESGQAFFVHSTALAGSLSFPETSKVDGSYLVSRPAGIGKQLRTNLYLTNAAGTSLYDGVLSEFDAGYSNTVDDMDAIKQINFGENLGISRDNKVLSVERMKELVKTDTIFYNLNQMRLQRYQLEFIPENIDQPGLAAFLEDKYLDIKTPVSLSDTTRIDFNIINVPGSYDPGRFRLVFKELTPVPVTFSSIRASRQRNDILVEWKVENELNIHHYDVEKSADGLNFSKVNETAARGNGSGAAIQYNWLDTNPFDGDNFYRVRSIGISNEVKLSQVVKVNMGKLPASITVFPNPVREDGVLYVSLANEPAGNYQFTLVNNEGQLIMKRSLSHSGGSSVYSIMIDKFVAHGNYLANIAGDNGVKLTFKVVY